MKGRSRRRGERFLSVDITPMMDMVFLLIIFFMTSAQFVRVLREPMDLPRERGEQSEQAEEAGFLINLTREGRFIVASRTLALEEMEALLAAEVERAADDPSAFKLLIRADRHAPSADLNALLRRLETMGIGAARLATEVPR